jgi:hypothetical protein
MTKECTKCKKTLSIEDFYRDKQKTDGLRSICKNCCREFNAEKRKNPKIVAEQRAYGLKKQKERIAKDPEAHREYNNRVRREKYQRDPIYRAKKVKSASDFKTKKRREDPVKRAIENARNRIRCLVARKTNSYSSMLGCKRDEFKAHIESLFQPGMSWNNYGFGEGKWNVDHKYPLSVAYKEGAESFAKACHYTNLQPLWTLDNILKSNKT